MSVLVIIEHAEGKLKRSAPEAISYAKAVADLLHVNLSALAIGPVAPEELASVGKYGAEKVLHAPVKEALDNQTLAAIIAEAARKQESDVVIVSNTFYGKGIAPHLAIKLKAGLVSGAVGLPFIDSGKFIVKKTAFSGKAFALVEVNSQKKVISLNPNSFAVRKIADSMAPVEEFGPRIAENSAITLKEVIKTTDKIPLPEASIVVSGGRGLKGPENWKLIEELAQALGAATACSKPVSDAGWRPHEEHVGQTGITVSPNLYIAIGISGAIQHLAGVSGSKTIVAINKDREAPFFKVADYGIAADAFDVVPKLIESVKKYKTHG